MSRNLNSVKIEKPYHHGHLREALLQAAEELLGEKGIEGFSLREVARRAGVSPSAPMHHFRDVRALFTAIASNSFEELATCLERAGEGGRRDRVKRLQRQGLAYVRFAVENRARFDLMWRSAVLDHEDQNYQRAAERAWAALDRLVRGDGAPEFPMSHPRLARTIACWSLVHGFAELALKGTFGSGSEATEQAIGALLPKVLECVDL